MLCHLPSDVFVHIFGFIPLKSLLTISRVTRLFRTLSAQTIFSTHFLPPKLSSPQFFTVSKTDSTSSERYGRLLVGSPRHPNLRKSHVVSLLDALLNSSIRLADSFDSISISLPGCKEVCPRILRSAAVWDRLDRLFSPESMNRLCGLHVCVGEKGNGREVPGWDDSEKTVQEMAEKNLAEVWDDLMPTSDVRVKIRVDMAVHHLDAFMRHHSTQLVSVTLQNLRIRVVGTDRSEDAKRLRIRTIDVFLHRLLGSCVHLRQLHLRNVGPTDRYQTLQMGDLFEDTFLQLLKQSQDEDLVQWPELEVLELVECVPLTTPLLWCRLEELRCLRILGVMHFVWDVPLMNRLIRAREVAVSTKSLVVWCETLEEEEIDEVVVSRGKLEKSLGRAIRLPSIEVLRLVCSNERWYCRTPWNLWPERGSPAPPSSTYFGDTPENQLRIVRDAGHEPTRFERLRASDGGNEMMPFGEAQAEIFRELFVVPGLTELELAATFFVSHLHDNCLRYCRRLTIFSSGGRRRAPWIGLDDFLSKHFGGSLPNLEYFRQVGGKVLGGSILSLFRMSSDPGGRSRLRKLVFEHARHLSKCDADFPASFWETVVRGEEELAVNLTSVRIVNTTLSECIVWLLFRAFSATLQRFACSHTHLDRGDLDLTRSTELPKRPCPRLTHLSFAFTNADSFLSYIAPTVESLPSLRVLDVTRHNPSAFGASVSLLLQISPMLRILRAGGPRISSLGRWPDLEELLLGNTTLTETEAMKLSCCSNLVHFRCLGNRIFNSPTKVAQLVSNWHRLRRFCINLDGLADLDPLLNELRRSCPLLEKILISGHPRGGNFEVLSDCIVKLPSLRVVVMDVSPYKDSNVVDLVRQRVRSAGKKCPKLILPTMHGPGGCRIQ